MRRFHFAGAALAMILSAACTSELPTVPDESALVSPAAEHIVMQASHHAAPPARPIRGTCELDIQPAEPVSPGVIRQLDVGTCQISHLGRSTMVSDKVIALMAGTQNADVALTAANGDMLHASGSGTNTMVAPGKFAFRVELTITGGTGRFSDASGMIVSEGVAELATATAQVTMAGTIRY
jgi:acyl-coenzyme A thioesterase PaaI-like protein